jgi:AcrR family transcriptional regulator
VKKPSDDEAYGRRGRPRCPQTDERVLQAALRQMAEVGYARMSLGAVAEEAGTTKPTIYRRWPGKEALAVAALEHLQAHRQPGATGSTEGDLRALLRDFQTKLLRPNGLAMIGTLLAEEAHTPGLIRLFRERIVRPRRRGLLAILRRARARGELRPGADLDMAVNMLVGSFYARYLTGEGVPAGWADRAVAAVMAGLRA